MTNFVTENLAVIGHWGLGIEIFQLNCRHETSHALDRPARGPRSRLWIVGDRFDFGGRLDSEYHCSLRSLVGVRADSYPRHVADTDRTVSVGRSDGAG